jgi:hypothetical protein
VDSVTMVVPVTTVGSAGLVTTVVPVAQGAATVAPAAIAKTNVSAGDGRGGPATGPSVRHAPERARPVSAS